MGIVQAGLLGIAGALLAVQFKSGRSEYSIYIAAGVSVLIFLGILGQFSVFLDAIYEIAGVINLDSSYVKTLVKMIGITYTSEFASSICKDAGYQTIAVQIEIFGKLMILVLSIPVVLTVLETIGEFLL
ncbi:MAG: stage III sporulation protein AD [Dorea sp.]|nr:stage III sporulation protein AD [Dorea sp.]